MRRYVTSICVFLSLLIFLASLCVLSCSAKMTAFLLEKQDSVIIATGAHGLDDARRVIEKDLETKVSESSEQAFEILTDIMFDESMSASEEEAQELYRKITLNILKSKYGAKVSGVPKEYLTGISTLESIIPKPKYGEVLVSSEPVPELILDGNQIVMKDVTVSYDYNSLYGREATFDASASIKDMTFYDENAELFTYAMVAGQGIYITGKTSTILGNVYAGTHSPSEMRKAEALYGETGKFGGINLMSTQVGMYADKIVTDGNVNLKGSFVVMGSDTQPMKIYAGSVNQTDIVASKNIYALIGEVSDEDITPVKTEVAKALSGFDNIEHFYDTDNDRTYVGRYRKIISSTDITVSNDVTGVIMTPGNVIIEEGVNVEGLIICGDRIYVQGNNNIVSSVDVMRHVLNEELYKDIYTEIGDVTLEEEALSALHLYMKDYFGGITYRGIH